MRALAIVLVFPLLAGCQEELEGEVHDSIGRPGAAAIEGRILEAEDDDDDPTVPLEALGAEGRDGMPFTVVIGGTCKRRGVTGADGLLRVTVPERCRLPAGRRRVEVRALGRRIAVGHLTVLPQNRPALAVTSDVDMTYLETRFRSAVEIASLLRSPAKKHAPLAGMPALYGRLRARVDALHFISGSPTFFRKHLEARLALDHVVADEVTLKHMGEIVGARWRQPRALERALREQVGYKLQALLEARLRLPRVVREVLLGDDTEMDATAYRLYRDTLAGVLAPDHLVAILDDLEVDLVRRQAIVSLLPRVRAWVRPPSRVVLIGIRETDRPNREHRARDQQDAGFVFHRDTATLEAALEAAHVL